MWKDLSLNSTATVWLNYTASLTRQTLFFLPSFSFDVWSQLITLTSRFRNIITREVPDLLSFVLFSFFGFQIVFPFPLSHSLFLYLLFCLSLQLHSGCFVFDHIVRSCSFLPCSIFWDTQFVFMYKICFGPFAFGFIIIIIIMKFTRQQLFKTKTPKNLIKL